MSYVVASTATFWGVKVACGIQSGGDPPMTFWDSAQRGKRSPHSHPWLADLVFALDCRLRRRYGVLEYSRDPSCVFRLQIARARQPLVLRDGTRVAAGDRIARLHLWNEHIPPVPENGATIGWARQAQRAIALSLRELADYLSSRPDLRDIAVICADATSGTKSQTRQLARIMGYYGFETIIEHGRLPIGERMHRFGENILISLMVLAQNAGALRLDSFARARVSIFISRRALEQRFGAADFPVSRQAVGVKQLSETTVAP
jgi:YkoP domain